MPWIFLCLMLANAAYFGWNFFRVQSSQVSSMVTETAAEGKRVVLLSEKATSLRSVVPRAQITTKTDEQPVIAPAMPQCLYVGPFASEMAARNFTSQMESNGFSSRIETRKAEEADFWVFIPPFTNREKAEERLRDLRARGIEGFVVRDGMFINSISLNHFSRRELAQAFLQRMQSAGISVEYREIKRSGTEFWAYLAAKHPDKDSRMVIDDYFEKNDGMRRENAACEE